MPKARTKKPKRSLNLGDLKQGIGAMTPASCEAMAEACAVCLEKQLHSSGVILEVSGQWKESFLLLWTSASQNQRQTWSDIPKATEKGACGLTFLLVFALTEYTVIERSWKGTGFDYWLGNDDDLFQRKARLEISGIMKGDASKIKSRVDQKRSQMDRSDDTKLPAYVSVIEFGTPAAKVVEK